MASTPTTNLLLEKQGKFENTETWDERLNAAIDQIDYAISGTAAIATTGGTTTLDNANYTVDDAKAAVLYVTGTLASNSEIVVPSTSRVYVVRNATSGAYSVTVKTSAGSGVVVTQGTVQFVAVDATADDTYAVSVAGALGVASDSGTASVDLETQSLTLTGGAGIDTSATGQAATIAIDSTVATLTGSQTLTNKSIDLASNTLAGTQAQFDTACSDGSFVYTDDIGASVQAYSANLDSWSGVAPSAYTTVASLAATTTSNGASLVGIEDSGGLITATTVEGALAENRAAIDAIEADYLTSASIGVSVQAYDADLTTWAGLTPSANAQSLVTAADYAAMRTQLDLEAGTDFYSISAADAAFQPLDSVLTDLAGITPAQGDIYYHNGTNLVALSPGTAGQVLQTNGAAANPSWATSSGGGGGPSVSNNSLIRMNDTQALTSATIYEDVDTIDSVDTGTDVITVTGHPYSDGQVVRLTTTGALPTGLSIATDYYIITATTNTFQLSTSFGGSAIDLTGAGSGTNTVYRPQNGMSAGPVTIETGTTITIASGSTWTILGV